MPLHAHGLLHVLHQAVLAHAHVRLIVPTRAGTGDIRLHHGVIRRVRLDQRGGMAALVALDVLAPHEVHVVEAIPAADQFGLLGHVVIEHARRISAEVQGLTATAAPVLAVDATLGTPLPTAASTTDDLLHSAHVTVRMRDEVSVDDLTIEGDFFRDLAADAATATAALAQQAPPEPQWTPPDLGQMLGKCYLSAEIGRGATSIVYRALHMSLKVDVAIKVFVPAEAGRPHLSIREARVLARLSHPHILRVLDCSEEPPWPHLVMEYVDGSSMADLIEQAGHLPTATAVGLVRQAAQALAYAHAEGVTHCDVKPGNLLLTRRQEVKVADLGVARLALGGDDDAPLESRAVVGTPAYIAPELVRDGLSAAGAPSDLYSLGATLYHALAGEPPFLHDDPLELMVRHVRSRLVPLRERVPAIDRDLDRLVEQLLAKDPSERPDYATTIATLGHIEGRLSRRFGERPRHAIYGTVHAALRGTLDRLLQSTTRRFTRRSDT